MAKDLVTNIIVNARTTEAFNQLGQRLLTMGHQLNTISSRVLEFEKESVNIYRSYEDNMLAAEFALSAQYKSATKLAQVMDGLDIAAREWASTTIFHTDDVSKAINEAAHAGWSYEEILLGIPEAMKIAQAGGLELSDGLDYLIKILNSTGTEFEKSGMIVDQWAKAANLSATDIGEMGEALIALGASATFADSTQEIFTLLSVLANVGSTGSQAGTLLRNAMMRVVAPTTKAEAAMSLLGADAEEINEILDDESVQKAAKKLEGLGFSAYDTSGNLKPMKTIFEEIYSLIKDLDESSQNEILGGIFPLRSINAAKAFMAAIGNGSMSELFINIGNSEGYAAEGAELMMSGLTGAIETLASKWEEFQRSLGETLAPGVESMAEWLGHIVDWLNGLDEPAMTAIAGALSGMAAAGPGLIITGTAMMLLSSKAGQIFLAGVAISALAGAITGYFEAISAERRRDVFGELVINMNDVKSALQIKSEDVDASISDLRRFRHAMGLTKTEFENYSTEMSESLFTKMATGMEIKEGSPEAIKLQEYGDALYQEVVKGLTTAQAADISLIENISEGDVSSPIYQNALALINAGFSRAQEQAAANSRALREAMTSAFTDGHLTPEEYNNIQNIFNEYNELMALTDPTNINYAKLMNKRNTVSLESLKEYAGEVKDTRNAYLEDYDAQWEDTLARLRLFYDWASKYGENVINPITGVSMGKASEIDFDTMVNALYGDYLNSRGKQSIKFDQMMMNAFEGAMGRTANGSVWRDVATLIGGGELTQEMWDNADALYDLLEDTSFFEAIEEITNAMGGKDAIKQLADQYAATEGPEAKELAQFYRLLGYLAYDSKGTGYSRAMGLLGNNDFRSAEWAEEEAVYEAERQAEINAKRIAELTAKRAEIQAKYDAADERYNKNINRPWFYQPGADKANLELWGNQLAAIDEELANLNGTVTMTVNPKQVEDWKPPKKYGFVFYQPTVTENTKLHSGRTGGGGDLNYTTDIYGEGGRATSPSIFGEAGAEWAIPEKHSERTADLLNMAREASGFTWGDLIARYGGLNAGNGSGVTLNYQPVINGGDGASISDALARDRDGLVKLIRKALDEARYRDSVAVYA